MQHRSARSALLSMTAAAFLAVSLSACGSGMALVNNKVEGYSISDDALAQIRPGQSDKLVLVVLGSPQTVNTFTGEGETAWYYVETKVSVTAFGLKTINERKVLAIYFDNKMVVKDKALYSAKDGKVITIESRKTPSYGADRTFIESMIGSFTGD